MEHSELFLKEDRYLVPSYKKSPLAVAKGSGAMVWDEAGRGYLDLYGGHAVCILGHCHPKLVQAIEREAQRLLFYSSVNYSQARAQAAERLVAFSERDMQVFFSNSGAEANENALKMAKLLTGKPHVISFEHSFHGRTLGALSVTGIPKYRKDEPAHVRWAKFGDLASVERLFDGQVGAVIIEAVQSLAGVYEASPEFFRGVQALCRKHGAFMILDEIQTGLGRTGHKMYFHSMGLEPDAVTLAKGLAGGLPAAATLVRAEWSKGIHAGDLGSTFGGGPFICALVDTTLRTLEEEGCVANAGALGALLTKSLREFPRVKEVRGPGLLLGIESDRPTGEAEAMFREKGVLVGTSLQANTFRLLPPLTLNERHVEEFVVKAKGIL